MWSTNQWSSAESPAPQELSWESEEVLPSYWVLFKGNVRGWRTSVPPGNFSGNMPRFSNSKFLCWGKRSYTVQKLAGTRSLRPALATLQRQKMKPRERTGMCLIRGDFRSAHIMKLIWRTVACLNISRVGRSLESHSVIKTATTLAECICSLTHQP